MHAPLGLLLLATAVSSAPRADLNLDEAVVLEAARDFVILEAGEQEDRQGRLLVEGPVDTSAPQQAGFRLPLPGRTDEDLGAVIVEVEAFDDTVAGFDDIPRDRSAPNQAGFRLPLPEAGDDAVIVEAGDNIDFPVDDSNTGVAGFRLPLAEDDSTIPRDESGSGRAGFRLPLSEIDAVVVEAGDGEGRAAPDIPRDNSGLVKAGFRLPLPDQETESFDDLAAVVVENEPTGRDFVALDAVPRDNSGPGKAGFRLPLGGAEVLLVGDEPGDVQVQADLGRSIDPSICLEEKNRGVCRGSIPSFFFNIETNSCEEFVYSGCGGSKNRFQTVQECNDLCA